jgi:hypothetical protein
MDTRYYAIIEVEDGMTIMEYDVADDPEALARLHQGTIVDVGPFHSYDAAYDELLNLEANEDDELVE